MARLKIYTFPDAVLAQKAVPIPRVEKEYFKLADDMLETMYAAPGVGLAANQVGILKRILVLDTEYESFDLEEGERAPEGAEVVGGHFVVQRKPIIVINPEIIRKEGEILFNEGCLSVPDYSADVKRAEKVTLQYQDIDGLTKKLDADGLLAVAIQHEIDHLDGRLFIERLSPAKKDGVKRKLLKERREREDGDEE
jgi:peptide deformylase